MVTAEDERYVRDTTLGAREFIAERLNLIPSSFSVPPSDLKLTDDEIHIWLVDLDQSESESQGFMQTLSFDERMRAGKFNFQKDRQRFMSRHGILRMILGRYLGIQSSKLRFYHGKNGKPAIAETSVKGSIQFNLSHSNGVALFAIARNHEIGVDIEHIRDIPEMEQIVERYFSIKEKDIFRFMPKSQQRENFFKCWTCKEALIKAIGDGMPHALDKFEVSMAPDEQAKLLGVAYYSRDASRWTIQNFRPAPDYMAAFAVKSHMFKTKRWRYGPLSGSLISSISSS